MIFITSSSSGRSPDFIPSNGRFNLLLVNLLFSLLLLTTTINFLLPLAFFALLLRNIKHNTPIRARRALIRRCSLRIRRQPLMERIMVR